jgi:hypothetical protein
MTRPTASFPVPEDTVMGKTPTISRLEPSGVEQGWEGTVKIHGSSFESSNFPRFDATMARTIYKTDRLLEAEVQANVTGTAGTKKVKVYTSTGAVSNEIEFVVSPRKG